MAPVIRDAAIDDAPAIRDIYNHEVLNGTGTLDIEPRSLESQRAWLLERSGAHRVLVAEVDGVVAGFASLSPFKTRAAYQTSVENSVYVAPDRQGEGIGSVLLVAIVDAAREHGFHTVIARIGGGNDASVALHQKLGFELVGVEREIGRKFGRWLDVSEMQLLL